MQMKTLPVFLAAVFGLAGLTIHSEASEASALRKAAGIYEGTGRGSLVSLLGDGTASLPTSVKVPRGTGAGWVRVDARSVGDSIYSVPVTITKATVNATGTRVTYQGRVTVPASYTSGFGTFSGSFTAVATLTGTPKLTITAIASNGIATVRVSFNGTK